MGPGRLVVAALLLFVGRAARRTDRPGAAAAAAAAPGRRGGRRVMAAAVAAATAAGAGAQEPVAAAEARVMRPALLPKFDINGDGRISRDEFIKRLPVNTLEPGREEDHQMHGLLLRLYDYVFDTGDISGDGGLDEHELYFADELYRHAVEPSFRKELWEALLNDELETFEVFSTVYYQQQLEHFDADGDGRINKDEYMQAMRNTAVNSWALDGFLEEPEFVEWLDDTYEVSDTDGDGFLNVKEVQFCASIGGHAAQSGVFAEMVMVNFILQLFDPDQDGSIKEEEIAKLVETAATFDKHTLSRQEKENLHFLERLSEDFGRIDANEDGAVDRGELLYAMKHI